MMRINLFDKLLEFVHAQQLGEDVLLLLVILRLKHTQRPIWRVDGLHQNRWQAASTTLYEHRPSEFICQDESFSCSPFNHGKEYASGIYFTQLWVTPTKYIAFLFTIEGSTVKLRKHLVFDPSDKETCWLKNYWSAYFWDEIEQYHETKTPELKGHRALGRYMLFPEDEVTSDGVFLKAEMSDRLADEFQKFPGRYLHHLLELVPVFAYIGVDIHHPDSSVLFLFLTPMTVSRLKEIVEIIRARKQSILMLVSNDPDIDDTLMKTGYHYALIHAMSVNDYSRLYFYRMMKNK